MEFNERLQVLRKKAGLSQEKLAEACAVSRQAVSKWEAGQSQPDMEKLIILSKLFGVSLDDLVKGEADSGQAAFSQAPYMLGLPAYHYEYKSKQTLFGIPLLHVNLGWGRPYVAKGIVAVGGISIGVVSLGVLAIGGLSLGAFALGVLAFAGIAAGLLASGGAAVGIVAFGGVAVGVLAFGGLAVGKCAVGGAALASDIAVGGSASGHLAFVVGDDGKKILYMNGRQIPIETAEQARMWILRAYPHLWKPVLHFLTRMLQGGVHLKT
ncbi:helix-turn-helix domain-containing protein [Ethanoligenens sp.]|uniref:helix-turn-helix domain-containing protein n=1 Tax=Ethanoligenens sp. TaxID=2099655 RepID=UPI0039E810F0